MQSNVVYPKKNVKTKLLKRKRRNYPKLLKRKFLLFFYNFCAGTAVHGCHYISDYRHVPFKTNLWILIDLISVMFSVFLIYIQLSNFSANTLSTNIASTAFPIWEIPFPAVTICNFNVVHRNNTQRIITILKERGVTNDRIEDFLAKLSSLINNYVSDDFDIESYANITKILDGAGYNVDKIMLEVGNSCDILLRKCWWKAVEHPCGNLFKVIKTNEGFCCSFNYYGTKDRQIENANKDDVRYFSGIAGSSFGLTAIMVVDEDQYVSPFKQVYGADVLVHDGEDYPDMSLLASSIMPNQVLTLGLLPSLLVGDNNIRSMSQYERSCIFEDEGQLEWTSIYSFQTCLTECKAGIIYRLCDCIPFFYPNPRYLRTCTLMDVPCLQHKAYEYNSLIIDQYNNTESAKYAMTRMGGIANCHCLPKCNELKYINYVDKKTAPEMDEFRNVNISIVNVHYNSITCVKMSKSLNVTWDMLLASIGGIFGLCIGGSVMSLIEVVYHFVDSFFYQDDQFAKREAARNQKIKFRAPKEKFITPISEYVN